MTRLAARWMRANGAFLLWLADQLDRDRRRNWKNTVVAWNDLSRKGR